MRSFTMILIIAMAFISTGCEKKTPSEQLGDDIKKAGKQIEKDLNNF